MQKQPYAIKELAKANNGDTSPSTSSSSSSTCYITTAVCNSLGRADDCDELNAFRKFRDEWLVKQPKGRELIEEYYKIAPQIVELIEAETDCQEIYKYIWQEYLCVCLEYLNLKKYEMCQNLYILMVNELTARYIDKLFLNKKISAIEDIEMRDSIVLTMNACKTEIKEIRKTFKSESAMEIEKELLIERLWFIHDELKKILLEGIE